MRGMPFNLQGKGVLEVAEISSISGAKWKKEATCLGNEPTSVLDTRRSPSPPTSTSTLSSSLGGGCGSTDTAGVAAVSDNPPQKWPPTQQQEDSSAAVAESGSCVGGGVGGSRKDEWTSELQPIPTALEIVSGGATGAEKCGLGMEDWESVLSESAASPSQEQSLLRWIMGDVDDPTSGLKHLLQGGGSSEFEGNAGGFGIVDQGFGFESIGAGASLSGNVMGTINPSLAFPGSVFPPNNNSNSNSNNQNGRVGSVTSVPNASPLPNYKVPCFASNNNGTPPNPIFPPSANNLPLPISFPPGVFYPQQQHQQPPQLEPADEKPQLFNPQLLMNQQQAHHPQNPPFLVPLSYAQQEQHLLLPPQPKRPHSAIDPSCQIPPKVPFADSGQELFLRRQQLQQQQQQQEQQGFPQLQLLPPHLQQRPTTMATKPKVVGTGDEVAHQQQQALVDQLFKAAELVEAGNSVHARGILARLNHQLSPVGKPLQRAAFYFKEALQLLLLTSNNTATSPSPRNSTHFDVVLKIGAYKAFSEISPLLQFANFTCNQALLEALDRSDRIHIIDFDIGIGGQWASFMQELASKPGGAPSLKITAFTSPTSHDQLELRLTRENLTHFANDLGIAFDLDIVNLDSFDPASWSLAPLHVSDSEAVAVNLPVGSSVTQLSSVPSLLRFVKQLSPKIVVSVDRGCDRSDLPFSHHFLYSLQSFSILLDSLDAVNVNSDAVHKIEKFLFQPRIEGIVLGRQRAPEKMLPWRNVFASAGFSPVPFTNFTETQAECLVKRLHVRGFHVEKRQASLILCWQRGELVSASAWRC
ncbi:PREDICTED: scarecrow-like protein 6 [Nelumbo nucifera]|uniref:Scarecrow-like protein 6 n=1 Tax=Nelumbo nucifera TaxID=4432 RepID=A0A1U7ZYP2_NELNU|nr:PREDICTED: scarecrow-like protein 6 [Nelumbo nucifera]